MHYWALLSALALLGNALPRHIKDHQLHDVEQAKISQLQAHESVAQYGKRQNEEKGKEAEKVELRILPFGGDHMNGVAITTDGTGPRRYLRTALRQAGYPVNMVGSRRGGTMLDNDHEAAAKNSIDDLSKRLEKAVSYKPNVVIINTGEDNANQDRDVAKAGSEMAQVLENLWKADDMSDSCVVLSTIVPSDHDKSPENLSNINEQFRKLVSDLDANGRCIDMADMSPPKGDPKDWIKITKYYEDPPGMIKTQVQDEEYEKMAMIFFDAILRLAPKIKPAKPAALVGDATGDDPDAKVGDEASKHETIPNSKATEVPPAEKIPPVDAPGDQPTHEQENTTSRKDEPVDISRTTTEAMPATTNDAQPKAPAAPAPEKTQTIAQPNEKPVPETVPEDNKKDCSKCEENLKVTDCEAGDTYQACLWAQCSYDKECQSCGIDCDQATERSKSTEGTKPSKGNEKGQPEAGANRQVCNIGPEVWKDGNIQCPEGAMLVFPPMVLPSKTTISVPPYVTTITLGEVKSKVTMTVPVIVMETIGMFNKPLESAVDNATIIHPLPSVAYTPVELVLGDGQTTNVTLPPWPYITMGPPEGWESEPVLQDDKKLEETMTGEAKQGVEETTGTNTESSTAIPLIPILDQNTKEPNPPPSTTEEWSWHSDVAFIQQDPPPQREPEDDEDDPEDSSSDDEKQTDDDDDDDDDDIGMIAVIPCNTWFFNFCPNLDKLKIKQWKIRFPKGKIGPGPPPPHSLEPPGWKIQGTLPPWPPLINPPGPGPNPAEFPEKPSDCEMRTASMCSTITSNNVEVVGGTTRTVTQEVSSTCLDISGCYVKDYETESKTENDVCTAKNAQNGLGRRERSTDANMIAQATASTGHQLVASKTRPLTGPVATSTVHSEEVSDNSRTKTLENVEKHSFVRRVNPDNRDAWAGDETHFDNCERALHYIIPDGFIKTPKIIERLELLQSAGLVRYVPWVSTGGSNGQGRTRGQTAFITVTNLPLSLALEIRQMSEVANIYRPETRDAELRRHPSVSDRSGLKKRSPLTEKSEFVETAQQSSESNATLGKRYEYQTGSPAETDDWAGSWVSAYRGIRNWLADPYYTSRDGPSIKFKARFVTDRPAGGPGAGQLIYLVDECVDEDHKEFSGISIVDRYEPVVEGRNSHPGTDCAHGTAMLSRIAGRTLGFAPAADIVLLDALFDEDDDAYVEVLLVNILSILDDLYDRGDSMKGKAVINVSMSTSRYDLPDGMESVFKELWTIILEDFDAVLVAASGNDARNGLHCQEVLPQCFKSSKSPEIANRMLVVGASDNTNQRPGFSMAFADDPEYSKIVHAPGHDVKVATPKGGYAQVWGSSASAAITTGVVAYLRSIERGEAVLNKAKEVVTRIHKLQRTIPVTPRLVPLSKGFSRDKALGIVKSIWTGHAAFESNFQDYDISCLDGDNDKKHHQCFPDDVAAPGGGEDVVKGGTDGIEDNGSGPVGNLPNIFPTAITWKTGEPSPTCSGENCGKVCEGDFCSTKVDEPPAPKTTDDKPSAPITTDKKAEPTAVGKKESSCSLCQEKIDSCPGKDPEACRFMTCQDNIECSECDSIDCKALRPACEVCEESLTKAEKTCFPDEFRCLHDKCVAEPKCGDCGKVDCAKQFPKPKPDSDECKQCDFDLGEKGKCGPEQDSKCLKYQCQLSSGCGKCWKECDKVEGKKKPEPKKEDEKEKPKPAPAEQPSRSGHEKTLWRKRRVVF